MACPVTNCSLIDRRDPEPNPDISGTGVLVGFLGTAYITFVLVFLRYIDALPGHLLSQRDINPVDRLVLGWIRKIHKHPPSSEWDSTLRSAVLFMSDQQLVTGIAILIGGYSQLHCSLSLFHWSMVVELAWFSSITHLCALTFIQTYLREDKKELYLRLPLMLVLVALLVVALIPTQAIALFRPGYAAECAFRSIPDVGLAMIVLPYVSVMAISQTLLVVMFLSRVIKCNAWSSGLARKWLRTMPGSAWEAMVRSFGRMAHGSGGWKQRPASLLYVLSLALYFGAKIVADLTGSLMWEVIWLSLSLIWGTLRLYDTRKNIKDSPSVLEESFWSFGQLVPVLLLLMPLLSIVATYLDRSRNPKPPEGNPSDSLQPVPDTDSGDGGLLGRCSRGSSFELGEIERRGSPGSIMLSSNHRDVAPSDDQNPPNPYPVAGATLDDTSFYQEPWVQDTVLFTALLILMNAAVILDSRSGSSAFLFIQSIVRTSSYWLQITTVLLLPLLYAVFQRNTRLAWARFIFGGRIYHHFFRMVYLISTLITLWVFLSTGVGTAYEGILIAFAIEPTTDRFGIVPLVPMLVLLYFPMFLLCVWVLIKPASIWRN